MVLKFLQGDAYPPFKDFYFFFNGPFPFGWADKLFVKYILVPIVGNILYFL